MFPVFSITLLLLYFWYFYCESIPNVSEPTVPLQAHRPASDRVTFSKPHNKINRFQFARNHLILWQHEFSDQETYMIRSSGDIIQKDDCYYVPPGGKIPATGQLLYEHLKKNPNWQNQQASFQENSPYTVLSGGVFYFKCRNRQIYEVGLCPSGTVFRRSQCIPVSSCTGKPDGTLIPDPDNATHYFECKNDRQFSNYCGRDKFFYHDRCVPRDELAHFCKFHPSTNPILLDEDRTKVQCLNGKPVYTYCSPGYRFFDQEYCEPESCVGKPDGTKLPLPDRLHGDFVFSPGYTLCYADKVQNPTTCPQIWDPLLSKGDDLTHLPMVFDGRECAVPSFCDNVFARDPIRTVVPVHEFTKYVRNWDMSELYDSVTGYACDRGQKRRRVRVTPSGRISKRFRMEFACQPNLKLPVSGIRERFYDCDQGQELTCPAGQFFQGSACVQIPENAFTYGNLPLFQFEPLNTESWIGAWNYAKPSSKTTCQPPESVYISLYNICSHPDCAPYDFLAMLPDLALFLPRPAAAAAAASVTDEKFKCRFDETTRSLRKEPTRLRYRFWEQRVVREELDEDAEHCTPGQKLKTGNFIYDSTVYATCDETQPFLFCPSVHTDRLIRVGSEYACDTTRESNLIDFDDTMEPTHFSEGEVKRILPVDWNGTDEFKWMAGAKQFEKLPRDGFTVDPGVKVLLQVTRPVQLELRYRVTHPPHIAFKYDDHSNERIELQGPKGKGFLIKRNDFTHKALTFPRYQASAFVDNLKKIHV